MKVHLRKRKLRKSTKSNPYYSLYLDIYHRKGKRKREFLSIYLEPQDTQTHRKEKMELANPGVIVYLPFKQTPNY